MTEQTTSVISQHTFVGDTPFHVIIDDSVTEIHKNAFCHCYYLRMITIPPNVNYIDDEAFSDCGAYLFKGSKKSECSNCRLLVIRCKKDSPAYYWVDKKQDGFIRVLY